MHRIPEPTSKRLGEYLACSKEQIEDALGTQSLAPEGEERRRIGELLLEMGAIDLPRLFDAIRAQRVDRLRACPLFRGLDDEDLAELSAVFQEVSIPAGEEFIVQGEHDPTLYVLAKGTCKVYRVDEAHNEIPLARLYPGEPVGEMGYFADGIRSASVRALEDVEVLRASYEDLTDCFESVPSVAAAFMEVISERLRKTGTGEAEPPRAETDRALAHLGEYLELAQTAELDEGVDRLLVRMVHSASRLMDADRATLFLVDPDTGELWSKVAEGADVREIRVPPGAGIVGWCVEHNELVNVEEAYEDPRFNPEIDRRTGYRTHTILCAPVRGERTRPLGAVQVINKHLGVFNEDDESLLRAFASQAAVAIENINLFRQVVRAYRRMGTMLDVATAISRVRDVRALSRAVAARLEVRMRCERARFYLLDSATAELWCVLGDGEGAHEERHGVTSVLAGQVLQSGEVINVRDAFEDRRFDPDDEGEGAYDVRCLLLARVVTPSGSPVGVLQVENRFDGVFSDEDEEVLRAVATQVGVSVLLEE